MPTQEWKPRARPNAREKTEAQCVRCGRAAYLTSETSSIVACWGCDELVGDCYCPDLPAVA